MNEKCECYAQVTKNDSRYEIWKQVDPDARVPLKHPIAGIMKNKTFPEGMTVYEGDPSRLTEKQKDVLSTLMAQKFNIPKQEVLDSLAKGVLPVKADNVIVSICNLHFRCMM